MRPSTPLVADPFGPVPIDAHRDRPLQQVESVLRLEGNPSLQEHVLLQRPTRTLIVADPLLPKRSPSLVQAIEPLDPGALSGRGLEAIGPQATDAGDYRAPFRLRYSA